MKLLRSPEERFMAGRKVILHFRREDRSLEGYLVRETPNSYWLIKARVLTGKANFDLEASILVPRDDVFFVQVLGSEYGL